MQADGGVVQSLSAARKKVFYMTEQTACCCGDSCCGGEAEQPTYVVGYFDTPIGKIPRVETGAAGFDRWGALKVRLGIGRHDYTVEPGLYCGGNPDAESPVLVTANYKLSFDHLRRAIPGINTWIMALDTKGINVWCAAGKGTFGTEELLHRMNEVGLAGLVTHKTLVLPQLGAPGVSAHEIRKQSGFRVVYGPVRAVDIPAFLREGMKATPEMRRVEFPLVDRLTLSPVEFANLRQPLLYVLGTLLATSVLGVATVSWSEVLPYLGAVVVGCLLVPALLPWIPGRAFAWKGWLAGIASSGAIILATRPEWWQALVYAAILPAISGMLAFNFTGSSTYTSRSGVAKELRYALPVFGLSVILGLVIAIVHLAGGR